MKNRPFMNGLSKLLLGLVIVTLLVPAQSWAKRDKKGATIVVTKTDGAQVEGELLTVKTASILLRLSSEFKGVEINVNEISQIRINKKSKFFSGIGKGLLIGAGTGALLGLASGDDSSSGWFSFSASDKALMGGFLLGLGGIIVGGISGLMSGTDITASLTGPTSEKSALLKKLNQSARFKNSSLDRIGNSSEADIPVGKVVINKGKKGRTADIEKRSISKAEPGNFKRFHLTIGARYIFTQASGGFKGLWEKVGFADTRPAYRGIWSSSEEKEYPRVSESNNISFKNISLEYSVTSKLMIGIGYSSLGNHGVTGYRYIPLLNNYYNPSGMYLASNLSGNFYYVSGALMEMPDTFLKKATVKLGGALGFSSTSSLFKLSRNSSMVFSGDVDAVKIDNKKLALMAFLEIKYFFNRSFSFGVNLNYKYVPVSIPSIQLSSE